MLTERLLLRPEIARCEIRAMPATHQSQIVSLQGVAECSRGSRLRMTELGPRVSGFVHFAEDGVERHVDGEFVEIIIAPDDGIGADFAVAELDRLRSSRGGGRGVGGR